MPKHDKSDRKDRNRDSEKDVKKDGWHRLDDAEMNGNIYKGKRGDDSFTGGDGDDTMIGSAGNDTFSGGAGIDTADYSRLKTAISVKSGGVVDKGELGTDILGGFDVPSGQLEIIEVTIGAEGQRNLVDATSVVGAVNINIDLMSGQSTYTVFVPTGGFEVGDSFTKTLVNFIDVNGTNNDDTILGSDDDNVFGGSTGHDVYDGRGGEDTLDYAGLGGAVTLLAGGEIDKGALGKDRIEGMETILGDAGQANTIDARVDGPQTTSLVADLNAGRLTIEGVPGVDALGFGVVNFVNVIGTDNADVIAGDMADNRIAGVGGSDQLSGGGGDDGFVFDGGDAGIDTISDFDDGDVLVLETGFGAFTGDALTFTDLFDADSVGTEIVNGADTISSDVMMDGVMVEFNGSAFAVLTGEFIAG
ncbi:MAG: hypothetical protein AAF968_04450 [Pseudomonadota bacterium]